MSGAAVLGEAIGGLLGALWTGQAVYRYKDPTTHKIVCRCGCYGPPDKDGQRSGSPQILDEREDCKTLNGIACHKSDGTTGTLDGCRKESVATRLVPEQLLDELLVKS